MAEMLIKENQKQQIDHISFSAMEMRVTTLAKSQSSLGTKRDRARNDKRFHHLPSPAAKQIKRTCRINRQIGHASPFSCSSGHKTVRHIQGPCVPSLVFS